GLPDPVFEALRWPTLAVAVVAALLLVAGLALAIRACVRRVAGWESHALLLIWFLAPLVLMSWQSSAVYIHYVLVLLPTPFLLVALALGREGGWRTWGHPRPPRGVRSVLPVALVGSICALHLAALEGFYAAVDADVAAPRGPATPSQQQAAINDVELRAKQAGIGELHGLPLRYWQSVADRAKQAVVQLDADPALARSRDAVVISGIQDDANRHLDRRRKALDYLLGPELQARFPLEGLVVVPSGRETLFVTLPEQELPRGTIRGASRLADIPWPGTNGSTRLWRVPAQGSGEQIRPRARSSARFDSGIRLLGLDAPARAQPGQTLGLISYWVVDRAVAPEDEDDEPFVELVDSGGTVHAYQARGGLPSWQWRGGDLLIQRASLTLPVDLPPGDYRLAAGLVGRADGARARLVEPLDATAPARPDAAPVATLQVRLAP
ncbi:MAG: hypothetical protein H0V51_19515, partial [Chloroflexi bacterium]|nr:hypothetical protein [Chloroflexota bacterium]